MWFLVLAAALADQPVPPEAPAAPPAPPPSGAAPAPPPAAPPVIDVSFSSDRVRSRVLPTFPEAAIRQGVRLGGCQVRFYVDEAGVPYRVLPVQCDDVFVDAAIAAGLQWRFQPWLEGGIPMKTKFNMIFIFEYQGPVEAPAR